LPQVRVGEELTIRLTPFSELQERVREMEKRRGIPREPIRYPGTTTTVDPGEGKTPPPNPLQGITSFL